MFETTTELLPHQVPAVERMMPTRVGGLFMDMGTGKTRVAIETVARRRQKVRRVIVYCPVSLKATWRREILKHTTCATADIHVFDDKTSCRNLPHAFWYIVGIESMSASRRVALAAHRLTTAETAVIVDESSYIKGHKALRTQRITRYSEAARYRMALTGTPMSQGVQDLYAQMRFLSPKILGYASFYSFSANHLEYSEKYPGLVVRAHNTAWLAAKIHPYVYQVTKDEAGLGLPPKLYDSRYFALTQEQQSAYHQAKIEILAEAEEIDSYVIFQLFGAMQQIASGFWRRDGQLLKFAHDRARDLWWAVQALPEDEKIIVWCKFRYSVKQVVRTLAESYGRAAVAEYHGGLSESERDAQLRHWRGGARFLVATMATGSHGLTLAEAAYAIFYENGFKYAERLQAEDRIHRIGQTRRPTYISIVADCGIENRIMSSLAAKGNAVDDFRRAVDKIKDTRGADLRAEVAKLL